MKTCGGSYMTCDEPDVVASKHTKRHRQDFRAAAWTSNPAEMLQNVNGLITYIECETKTYMKTLGDKQPDRGFLGSMESLKNYLRVLGVFATTASEMHTALQNNEMGFVRKNVDRFLHEYNEINQNDSLWACFIMFGIEYRDALKTKIGDLHTNTIQWYTNKLVQAPRTTPARNRLLNIQNFDNPPENLLQDSTTRQSHQIQRLIDTINDHGFDSLTDETFTNIQALIQTIDIDNESGASILSKLNLIQSVLRINQDTHSHTTGHFEM